jgi:hypothetical protein
MQSTNSKEIKAGKLTEGSNENAGPRAPCSNLQPKNGGLKVRRHTRRFERISRGMTKRSRRSEGASCLLGEVSMTRITSRRNASSHREVAASRGLTFLSRFCEEALQSCGNQLHQGVHLAAQNLIGPISLA